MLLKAINANPYCIVFHDIWADNVRYTVCYSKKITLNGLRYSNEIKSFSREEFLEVMH